MERYDVVVLGGGSAGTTAARTAAEAGKRTLMINDGELGGLCILRGCMPTKAMLASTHLVHEIRHAESLGLRVEGTVEPDFDRIMARKDAQVARFRRAKIASIERAGYEVRNARARFAPGGGIEAGGRRIEAGGYVVATGSTPVVLPLPGLEHARVLTSDDVMRLDRRPDSLVVQGAGAVGLELAQFFARVGSTVTLVNRSPLLSHYDRDAGDELRAALDAEPNLTIHAPATIAGIEPAGERSRFRLSHAAGETVVEAEAILMATGRRPALDDLGLPHAGVEVDDGFPRVDEHLRTTNPRVWAAGDALGRFQILHVANQEARIAGANAAGADPPLAFDDRLAMECIFTDPPFARVGRTEVDLAAAARPVVSAIARLPETGRAITMGVAHGLWKLHADAESGEILGTSIVGPRADDLVHVVAAVMAYRGRVHHLLDMPWYHPTLTEVLLSLARDLASRVRPTATGA